MTSDDYLTVGVAYASIPTGTRGTRRRTGQLNWWLPVYDIDSDTSMAFHPRYWDGPVENSSSIYDYDEWTRMEGRKPLSTSSSDTTRPTRAEKSRWSSTRRSEW